MTDISIRRGRADDLPAVIKLDGRTFHLDYSEQDHGDVATIVDLDRSWLAHDSEGRLVGTTLDFPMELTLPGGAIVDVPGISWVSTATTHRRRGVLRSLFTEQHRAFVEAGYAASILTASEGGIYGRFGYGSATPQRRIEVDRRRAAFRTDVADPGGVWQADTDEARAHGVEVYDRWRRMAPGAVARSSAIWNYLTLDRDHQRDGRTALRFVLHADGYLSYRVRSGERDVVEVMELVACTQQAYIALWRTLLGLDLIDAVRAWVATDEPLPLLLTDPCQVRTITDDDGMWLRPLDVAALLAARRYVVEFDIVLEIGDDWLGRGGRFHLRGGPDGAECARTDRAADLTLGVDVLGMLVLGGNRASGIARAGRLHGDQAVVHRFDAALLTARAPRHGTGF